MSEAVVLTVKVDSNVMASVLFIDLTVVRHSVTSNQTSEYTQQQF